MQKEEKDIYKNVPGQGRKMADKTWWTNASVSVGHVCTVPTYYRSYLNGKAYASDKVSECIETAFFDGKPFARWKDLPNTPEKECAVYTNGTWEYRP